MATSAVFIGIMVLGMGCGTPSKPKSFDRRKIEAAYDELEGGSSVARQQTERRRDKGIKPAWIDNVPSGPSYYHGVGLAQDWEESRVRALGNLASQIKVQVRSVVRSVVAETGYSSDRETDTAIGQEFVWVVETLADQTLQDFELVDKWRGEGGHWTYVRLSKAKVKKRLARQLDDARALALDHFKAGRSRERAGEVGEAIKAYVQGWAALRQFLGQPVMADFDGRRVVLNSEIQRALSELLSAIEMMPRTPLKLTGVVGKPLVKPLVVELTCRGLPISNLPVSFFFVRGQGRLSAHSLTDRKGLVRSEIYSIDSEDLRNAIEVRVDLTQLVQSAENGGHVLDEALRRLGGPVIQFTVSTAQTRFFIKVTQLGSGLSTQIADIENLLKSEISRNTDTVFTPVEEDARYAITGSVSMRKGTRVGDRDLYTAYATVVVTVKDLQDNIELFKREMADKKAGGRSFVDAGHWAVKKAAQETTVDLVRFIQEELSY